MPVLAHIGHTLVEPALVLALPVALVAAWEWRDRRRRVPARVHELTPSRHPGAD